IRQFSTGNGTNPQDIAFRSPTKAYVPLYDRNEILIVDPSTGSLTGSIDLTALADADGYCEVSRVFIRHDILFATVQRLDRTAYWGPSGDSYIAVIDCAADTLIDTDPYTPGIQPILLTGSNPFSELVYDPGTGDLLVSCVGWWGMQDGGIEAIDIDDLSSNGFILTESAAGGDINDFQVVDGSTGYAVVTNASFHTELIDFDPAAGTRGSTIYAPGAYVINDIELSPGGELFLADQSVTSPGIRIYDAATGVETTTSPISTGLPPFNITFSNTETSSTTPRAASRLENCYPNPFNPVTTIVYDLAGPSAVRMEIFDVNGAKVRRLEDVEQAAGRHKVVWDGSDDSGRPCVSGIYFLRFMAGGKTDSRKLVLMR
ncbi:MAG TPA: FlgD immunoglobulin-like domain containing protein, partial [Candidatus Krumholzibacterium sp.]|nr:FlgD immunoglobulin-like domain containing protein [Candidatus Krumholzibacterium sp.]